MTPCAGVQMRRCLGLLQVMGTNVVPDSDMVIVGKTWALPEGSQRSRHTTVLSIQVSQ